MNDPQFSIQWKGTRACGDFTCRCGNVCHFDEEFLYFIRCRKCRALYRVPDILPLEEIPELPPGAEAKETCEQDEWVRFE